VCQPWCLEVTTGALSPGLRANGGRHVASARRETDAAAALLDAVIGSIRRTVGGVGLRSCRWSDAFQLPRGAADVTFMTGKSDFRNPEVCA
jgi:hypothetical protein